MKPTPPAGKFMERKPPRKEATAEERSGLGGEQRERKKTCMADLIVGKAGIIMQ